jgi:hypothetical protein
MANKKLQNESKFEKYDLDGDGIVSDEEFEMDQKLVRLENEDKKEDAQRNMTWFALAGLLLYPVMIILCNVTGQEMAADNLTIIAPTYCIAVVGIVAAFFGAQAYKGKSASAPKAEKKY